MYLALFPGLSHLQVLIACSMRRERPGKETSVYYEETSIPAYLKLEAGEIWV